MNLEYFKGTSLKSPSVVAGYYLFHNKQCLTRYSRRYHLRRKYN